MPLTIAQCSNAVPRESIYRLSDGNGLYLEVHPTGGRYWRYKYRFAHREKRLALGVFPTIQPAEARQLRDQAKFAILQGQDPGQLRQAAKREAVHRAANTFRLVACEWHEHQLPRWSKAHGEDILHRLEKDLFPKLGHLPIDQVKAGDIYTCLQGIEKRGAHETARRALQYSRQIMKHAVITSRIDRDPSEVLQGALRPFVRGHYAAIGMEELPELLTSLADNDARLFLQTRLAIRLLMLTFVRTGELIGAEWSEIDFDRRIWTIPASRMKMRRQHVVPLSNQAIRVLDEQRRLTGSFKWVFPNHAHPVRHMSNNTILCALKRLGYGGRMTGHGFRALAMSNIKEKLGYRHEVVDRQLAHGHKSRVDAAYDRAQFLDERTTMMQHWADLLDSLVPRPQLRLVAA